jgi:AraC-like DNA-binding protein
MSFEFDQRPSDSPFIERIWRTQSEQDESFISTASVHWEMVLARHEGEVMVAVRGPETRASLADAPADAEWLGITFKLGAFMPGLPPGGVLDRCDAVLPGATSRSFWLNGATWEFPTYDNADTFVARLAREGVLTHEPLVDAVLQQRPPALSARAVQYRFLRATGLTQNKVQQIERATRAAALLAGGMSILDVVHETGYFDQAHLTNSLKRLVGQTPAQIVQPGQAASTQ